MTTKPAYENHAWWEHLLMFLIVSSLAKLGGTIIMLFQGYKIWKIKLPNCLGPIKIPSLVGMVFMGMLA